MQPIPVVLPADNFRCVQGVSEVYNKHYHKRVPSNTEAAIRAEVLMAETRVRVPGIFQQGTEDCEI